MRLLGHAFRKSLHPKERALDNGVSQRGRSDHILEFSFLSFLFQKLPSHLPLPTLDVQIGSYTRIASRYIWYSLLLIPRTEQIVHKRFISDRTSLGFRESFQGIEVANSNESVQFGVPPPVMGL
jgi:hypothetical protein